MHAPRPGPALLACFVLALLVPVAFALQVPERLGAEARLVVRVHYENLSDIRALADFDLWEYNNVDRRYVLVAVDATRYEDLAALGFRLELDEALTEEINATREVDPTQVDGIPGFPCYRTVEETFATAQQMLFQFPGLASWLDVGDSWEKQNGLGGYDMRVLRLTNLARPGPKPKLFVTSSIHAREYTPAELMTRFAEYLVHGHGVDADATWILDHHEVHLMLQANPDGRKKAETGMFWRKNTNQSYCSPTSSFRGADLNRNFEFEWGCCGGSSGSQCSETYRGPFAGSEPETWAVQSHLLAEFPDQRDDPLDAPAPTDAEGVYIDIHSYSELVLWPWGFGGTAPNSTALQSFGRKLAYFNGYSPKQAIELYPTDGTTIDFAYGELGVPAFVFELGTSFFQDCSTFENVILPDNLPALIYAAKVVRKPYRTPVGPDALQVSVTPPVVFEDGSVELSATIDDTRFNNSNGVEPSQAIVAAEYYVDLPPWDPGNGGSTGMFALDGTFDGPVESVTATVSAAGLEIGPHLLFVRGRDADGNWGAFSAAFVTISSAQGDDDNDGVTNGADCEPEDPLLWAEPTPARDLAVTAEAADNLTWVPPAEQGAAVIGYQVLRSSAPSGFDQAICVDTGIETIATDADTPTSGSAFYYLIRAKNRCGENMGDGSGGQPRVGAACEL